MKRLTKSDLFAAFGIVSAFLAFMLPLLFLYVDVNYNAVAAQVLKSLYGYLILDTSGVVLGWIFVSLSVIFSIISVCMSVGEGEQNVFRPVLSGLLSVLSLVFIILLNTLYSY